MVINLTIHGLSEEANYNLINQSESNPAFSVYSADFPHIAVTGTVAGNWELLLTLAA